MIRRTASGFTLVELMIVVAVVAILASIAYPAYTSAILKGKRAQARTALLELLQQEERYMTQNNTYLVFTNTAGITNPASVPFKAYSGDDGTNPAYYLSASACPSAIALSLCVQVVATPAGTDPEAGSLWARSTGEKNCTGTAGTNSSNSPPKTCWP